MEKDVTNTPDGQKKKMKRSSRKEQWKLLKIIRNFSDGSYRTWICHEKAQIRELSDD